MNIEQFEKAKPIAQAIAQEQIVLQKIQGSNSIEMSGLTLYGSQYSGFDEVKQSICHMIQKRIDQLSVELEKI